MQQEILLLNFRIPIETKTLFEEKCHHLRTNMTAELNRMIRDFIKEPITDTNEPLTFYVANEDWRTQCF